MTIAISFDPTDASDVEYIQTLLATPDADEAPAPPAPKKATKAKAAAAAEPEPEEEPAEDGAATLEQAVERAQELVAEGRSAEVKGALTNFGVKRVSELEAGQFQEFLDLLNEESVV